MHKPWWFARNSEGRKAYVLPVSSHLFPSAHHSVQVFALPWYFMVELPLLISVMIEQAMIVERHCRWKAKGIYKWSSNLASQCLLFLTQEWSCTYPPPPKKKKKTTFYFPGGFHAWFLLFHGNYCLILEATLPSCFFGFSQIVFLWGSQQPMLTETRSLQHLYRLSWSPWQHLF